MAVKNGAAYIAEQIDSILCQLEPGDELVVSDDHSTDNTLDIIRDFNDPRIKIYSSSQLGIARNFEHALSRSSGDYIFLADQDDIWDREKLSIMLVQLHAHDLVVCDCRLVNNDRGIISESFFELKGSGRGFVKNLISNSYMGCCMGFRRRVLERALPFPGSNVVHDFWIGMIAEAHFSSIFLNQQLVSHRMHSTNASTSGRPSKASPMARVSQRYQLVRNLISRSL